MTKKNDKVEKQFFSQEEVEELLNSLLSNVHSSDSPGETLRQLGFYYVPHEISMGNIVPIQQDILLKHVSGHTDDLHLIINSVGGECDPVWGLVTLMDFVTPDIETVGIGSICSAATQILAAGTKGKRKAAKNALLMTHRFSWGMAGSQPQLIAANEGVKLEHQRDIDFWLTHSNMKTQAEVEKHILKQADTWMTAQQAKKLGIIDTVIG